MITSTKKFLYGTQGFIPSPPFSVTYLVQIIRERKVYVLKHAPGQLQILQGDPEAFPNMTPYIIPVGVSPGFLPDWCPCVNAKEQQFSIEFPEDSYALFLSP